MLASAATTNPEAIALDSGHDFTDRGAAVLPSSRDALLVLPLAGLLVLLAACRTAPDARAPEPAHSAQTPAPEASAPAGPSPDSPITKDDIRDVVRRHISDVRDCYNDGLARDRTLSGRVLIAFAIDATGAVTESSVTSSELSPQADDVAQCIAAAAKNWRFPVRGPIIVSYPFVLEPSQQTSSPSRLVTGTVDAGKWFAVGGFPPDSLVVEVVSQGATAPGVTVRLKVYTSEGEYLRTAVSDAQGRVVFSDLPPSGSAIASIEYAPERFTISESATLRGGSLGTILLLRSVEPVAN